MATTEIQKIAVPLIAPVKQLGKDLGKASKLTDDWGARTRQSIDSTAKAFGGVGLASAATLTAVFASTSSTADQLGKLSDKLGELPSKLQAVQRAGELTGVGVETTNMALQRMVRRVAEAANGTGEAVGALSELNINAKELAQLSPAEQFKAISDSFGDVATQGDRVRLAMKLFDSEGVSLVNTLALGSDGLREIEDEMSKYGEALTRVDIAKIEAANDEFTKTKGLISAFGTQFTAELAPVVGAITAKFRESAEEAGGFGEVGKRAATDVADAFAFAADVINGLQVVFLGLKAGALQAIGGITSGIALLDIGITKLIDSIPGLQATTSDTIQGVAESIAGQATNAAENFQNALLAPPPSEKIKSTVREIMDQAQAEAEVIAQEREGNIGSSLTDVLLPATAANDETPILKSIWCIQ